MQVRAGTGWQYALADLSLILFMVTALALARAQAPARKATANGAAAVVVAEPVAVWREAPGAPSLSGWLSAQRLDPRQRLTIAARFTPGREEAALARAASALQRTGKLPATARIVIERGDRDELAATLTWDAG